MALRGETIGRAYVKILADGSGLPDSIKDEMNDVTPVVKAAGGEHGEAYADEFKKRSSQEDIGKSLREQLERSIARADVAEKFFNSRNWKSFLFKLKKEFGDAGIVAGHELETKFAHNVEGIGDSMRSLLPEIDRIKQGIIDLEVDSRRPLSTLGSHFEHNAFAIEKSFRNLTRFSRYLAKDGVPTMVRGRVAIRRFAEGWDTLGDGIARVFGKGSRNNFLNFFGSMVGNLVRLPALIGRVVDKFIGFGASLAGAFVEAGGGAAGFASVIAKLAPMLLGAGFALVGLIAILGFVTSALSLLAGVIVAVTSSILFGLIGALAPLVGLLAPIAFAVAALAAAFVGLSDKQKKALKEAFEPTIDALKELGTAAREPIMDALIENADKVTRALSKWKPLFGDIGRVFGGFIDDFSSFANSKEFNRFRGAMEDTIPSAIKRLGEITGNVFQGLMGIFVVLGEEGGPVDRFLDWMVDLTDEFAEWANSKSGREEIREFLEDASESAEIFGGFLSDVWDLVKKLFFSESGKAAGDNIIKSLGDSIEDFAEGLSDKDLEEWFGNAEEFADSLGELAASIGKFATALDTMSSIVIWFTDMSKIPFDLLAEGVDNVSLSLDDFQKKNAEASDDPSFWDNLREKMKPEAIIPWLGSLFAEMGRELKTFGGKIGELFGKINWPDIDITEWFSSRGLTQAVVSPFNGLSKKISDKIGTIDLPDIIHNAGQVLSAVTAPFRGLAGKALDSMGTFALDKIIDISNVVQKVFNAFPTPNSILASIGKVAIETLVDIGGVVQKVFDAFPTASEIIAHIGQIAFDVAVNVDWPDRPGWLGGASGGVFTGPTRMLIGEAGPEALVPLNRPLSQVDPAVRELSAIAQGKSLSGTEVGKGIDVGGITIITPTEDPAAVAHEVINQLVGSAYF